MRIVGVLVIVVAALVLGVWVAVAVFADDSGGGSGEGSVTVVLNDFDKLRGKKVAVSGDVKTSLAPWAVLLGSPDASEVGLLVVARKHLPKGARMTARVSAVGTAKPFSLAAFRRAHPQVTATQIARSPLRDLNGRPALVDARVVLQPTPE
jgi:hypothetical protein